MAGPGVVVVASFITLWLAVRSNDGLVADDYYKKGVAINLDLARSIKARELGVVANVRFGAERVAIQLQSRDDLPGRIRVTVAHPTRAGLDQTLVLSGTGGLYQGALEPLTPGRWQLIITDESGTWKLASEIQLPEQLQLTLHPSEQGVH